PDGKRILTGSEDKSVKLWDAETGQEVFSLQHRLGVSSVAFSPDGKRILAGGGLGGTSVEAKVWDAVKGQEIHSLKGHTSPGTSVAWSPDGKRILSGSRDKTARVWDTKSGQELLILNHSDRVNSVSWSPDGKHILTGGGILSGVVSLPGEAKVWNAET